jgi:SNF2 family DNA or RNA helicase
VLIATPKRPEWYVGDRATLQPILGLPGAKMLNPDRWQIHRSHLPLIPQDADAARILTPTFKPDWAARDRLTEPLGFKLRNVQQSGIDFILQRRGTLLGDDPRVGKSLTSIMAHDPASGPFVVICPAMVRPVWVSWLRRVFPDEPIGVLVGRTFDPKVIQHKLVVGHYEILPWWQSAAPIGTIVFDEAHMLTNRNARRSKAAVYLAMRAKRVICATGTPIWNMPTDLWNVLGLVVPGAFGGYHEFASRYGLPVPGAHGTKYTGVSHEEELHARLSEVMIRRRWIDVADDLPAITRNVSLVELDDDQKLKLNLFVAELTGGDKATTIGVLSRYRKKLSTIKRPAVLKEAAQMLDRGEPVVIWTWHVELAEQIAKALGDRAFLLTGEVTNAKRDDAMAAWKAHPAAALVCTMSVAQVGLDFSHAHLAIFAEIDYTPAILAQAEMRTYAPTRPMNITFVVVDHLIEQRITMALIRKLGAANPLGVGAANDAITTLQFALQGPIDEPDMDRLLADFIESS